MNDFPKWQHAYADAAAQRKRGDCYRARAMALVVRCWRYRARWRMAEMEVMDCIKLVEMRTNQYDQARLDLAEARQRGDEYYAQLLTANVALTDTTAKLAAAHARAEAAEAELERVRADLADAKAALGEIKP